MDSEQREGIKEGKIMDKGRHCLEYQAYMELTCYKCPTWPQCQSSNIEDCMGHDEEPKPDKIEWCPQHGYPLPCAKCGMPKPDKPSRLLTGNEWMDIWATGGDDEKHRRVYVDYLSGLIRQDDKTASLVRAEVGECIENNIRASILTDDGWVYTIPASLVERFKAGTMPDKD